MEYVVPVLVEGVRPRVEEHEPAKVRRALRLDVHLGEDRVSKKIGGEDIQAPVSDEHRHVRHGLDELLQAGADLLRAGDASAAPRLFAVVGGADQVVDVGAFGVELQRVADSFENCFGDALGVAAFEADVVLNAHPGDESDFFASEPGGAAFTAEVREPYLLGGESGPSRGQKLAAKHQNWDTLDAVRGIADKLDVTPSEVSLSWRNNRPGVTAPIIGAKTLKQLEDNIVGAEATELLDTVSVPKPNDYPYGPFGVKQRDSYADSSEQAIGEVY